MNRQRLNLDSRLPLWLSVMEKHHLIICSTRVSCCRLHLRNSFDTLNYLAKRNHTVGVALSEFSWGQCCCGSRVLILFRCFDWWLVGWQVVAHWSHGNSAHHWTCSAILTAPLINIFKGQTRIVFRRRQRIHNLLCDWQLTLFLFDNNIDFTMICNLFLRFSW